MVEELHALLAGSGTPGPYVLVGWSFGGLTTRLYAYEYPDAVAGLVLLDASHERQLEVLGGRPSPLLMAVFGGLPGFIASGVPALAPGWVPRVDAGVLPPDAVAAAQALTVMSPKMAQAALAELQLAETSMAEVAAARAARSSSAYPLGDLPLVVLMKGRAESIPGLALPPDEQQARWLALQSDLAAQSTQGRLVVAEHSGHNIPYQQPELVTAAIFSLLSPGAAHAEAVDGD
jgi:pimeloyl-ACP methyl ester carboxylesterase